MLIMVNILKIMQLISSIYTKEYIAKHFEEKGEEI